MAFQLNIIKEYAGLVIMVIMSSLLSINYLNVRSFCKSKNNKRRSASFCTFSNITMILHVHVYLLQTARSRKDVVRVCSDDTDDFCPVGTLDISGKCNVQCPIGILDINVLSVG